MKVPWRYSEEDFQSLLKNYHGKYSPQEVRDAMDAFHFSSYKVGSIAVFAIYVVFTSLVIGHACLPSRFNGPLARAFRAHLKESPLITRRHHRPVRMGCCFGTLEVRLPLRLQGAVILAIALANIVPIFAFYEMEPTPVIFHGPHAKRNAIARFLADRTSILGIGMLPLIILTGGRQPLGRLSGMSFNDAMLYHRWLARFAWLQINLHGWTWVAKDALAGTLWKHFTKAWWNWGCLATGCFWALTILSMRELRERSYELFVSLHVALGILAIAGTYLHINLILQDDTYACFLLLTAVAAGLWILDRLIRIANRFWITRSVEEESTLPLASVQTFGSVACRVRIVLPATRIAEASALPSIVHKGKIKAGLSIRLLLPRLQLYSDHPFTVIDSGLLEHDSDHAFLDLLIRPGQGMTKNLCRTIDEGDKQPLLEAVGGTRRARQMQAVVEGPYGTDWSSSLCQCESLLFAGGAGIAFCLPLFAQAALHSSYRCKLVWAVREIEMVQGIEEQLLRLAQHLRRFAGRSAEYRPCVEVHFTDSSQVVWPASPELRDTPATSQFAVFACLAASIQDVIDFALESKGRPVIDLDHHVGRQADVTFKRSMKLTIVSCGPASLCDDVRLVAVSALRRPDWSDVQYIEECFDW